MKKFKSLVLAAAVITSLSTNALITKAAEVKKVKTQDTSIVSVLQNKDQIKPFFTDDPHW